MNSTPHLPTGSTYRSMLDMAERQQQARSRQDADDVTVARAICDRINAIPEVYLTPAVVAQIVAVLSARTTGASWSHFAEVDDVTALLDTAHETLNAVARSMEQA